MVTTSWGGSIVSAHSRATASLVGGTAILELIGIDGTTNGTGGTSVIANIASVVLVNTVATAGG